MPNRKQIIVISVLGIVALMLGCKPNATGIGEDDSDSVEPNPVKELTPEEMQKSLRDSVVGEYEGKALGDIYKYVLLEDEIVPAATDRSNGWWYENGKKQEWLKWSISNGEIHVKYPLGWMEVYRINKDKSITVIAEIGKDGKRKDITNKKHQLTWKNIK